MAYATWANFAYYNTGNIVSYQTINYSALQANINQVPTGLAPNWQVLPAPSGAGVSSLIGGTGALTMSINSGTASLVGNDVQLDIAYPTAVDSLNALTGAVNLTSPNSSVGINVNGQDIELTTPLPYSLTGTTAGAVIVNHPIGAGNTFPQNNFSLVAEITFNLPAVLAATDGVYYDGYLFTDWQANFNSFWGVSYNTNTFPTFTDILGSTSTTANALQYSNFNQIYLPMNIILPPTHLTSGGTATLRVYCNPTSNNHYLTTTPINLARIGIVSD
jgi:hypothetical protein